MLLIDPDTAEIIDANDAACSYYGYSYEKQSPSKRLQISK